MTALPSRVRALVRVSGALAARGAPGLEEALEAASRHADPREVEEVLLQSYLFLGYPTALEALARWRRVEPRVASEATDDDWDAWVNRGREVCARVYGGQYRRLRQNVRALHPDLERWMVAEGYGKVLGRAGLELVIRELCIVALLAVLGAPTQLYSHLRGALNVGAEAREIREALEAVDDLLDGPAREAVRETWDRVLDRQR